jgi:hypothetical protein
MLNFLGIGAQKSGTTWLYEMLRQHEAILFPAGKEVHFWDTNLDKGFEWYKSLFTGEEEGKVKGEITPAYAIMSQDIVRYIYFHYPELRLLYIIRNPIERAWSSALMALERAEMDLEEASDQWFIDHFTSRGSLARGDYEICIRTWRGVYPSNQLLILCFEMLRDNPREFLICCCQHLGVDDTIYRNADIEILKRPVFPGNGTAIRPTLMPVLERLYKKKIISLSNYLQQDFSDWLCRKK